MFQNNTECECQPNGFPFFCVRHQCMKIERWFELCRTEPVCFRNWEQGTGHGQVQANGDSAPSRPPPLLYRVWNFTKAVAAHVAGGCQSVSTEEYAARLAICETCPDRQDNLCLKCGCYLSIKAHWRSMQCPLQKWPDLVESPRDGPVDVRREERSVKGEVRRAKS